MVGGGREWSVVSSVKLIQNQSESVDQSRI